MDSSSDANPWMWQAVFALSFRSRNDRFCASIIQLYLQRLSSEPVLSPDVAADIAGGFVEGLHNTVQHKGGDALFGEMEQRRELLDLLATALRLSRVQFERYRLSVGSNWRDSSPKADLLARSILKHTSIPRDFFDEGMAGPLVDQSAPGSLPSNVDGAHHDPSRSNAHGLGGPAQPAAPASDDST